MKEEVGELAQVYRHMHAATGNHVRNLKAKGEERAV